MKNLFIFILTLGLSFITYAQTKVKGNGDVTKITRSTDSYNAISCIGPFDFILVAGTEGNLTLEGESNLLEYIETKVEKGHLIIKAKDKVSLKTSMGKTIKITIPFTDIDEVSLAGSGDLWNEDVIKATKFLTALAGSGDIILKVETTDLEGELAGSGDVTYIGSSEKLSFRIAGSGDLHAFKLNANNANISISGSGDAKVNCNKSIKGQVAGSGDIEYKGNPEIEEIDVSGSGSAKSI